nr:hypothetical protein Iba_chr11bCG3720 [Ipomoea batatas]GMD54713.1 hypothetical protein Iba_chr11dCG1030 [Ipomoea batatas]GMD56294.1 hypothetical protein Iba_chr11eCG1800 [Ipomoea batatas]
MARLGEGCLGGSKMGLLGVLACWELLAMKVEAKREWWAVAGRHRALATGAETQGILWVLSILHTLCP